MDRRAGKKKKKKKNKVMQWFAEVRQPFFQEAVEMLEAPLGEVRQPPGGLCGKMR